MADFSEPANRLMVALDFDELEQAEKIIDDLEGLPVTFEVGNQLGTYEGWKKVIDRIHRTGAKIFCDAKFKDILATVEKSARVITRHRPGLFNIMVDKACRLWKEL